MDRKEYSAEQKANLKTAASELKKEQKALSALVKQTKKEDKAVLYYEKKIGAELYRCFSTGVLSKNEVCDSFCVRIGKHVERRAESERRISLSKAKLDAAASRVNVMKRAKKDGWPDNSADNLISEGL